MGMRVQRGFTIIETMLVLAITGALVAALLVGVGNSIAVQRYRDSVVAFKSLLQDQYAQVTNVSNDRNQNWTCSTSAKPVQSGQTTPGQSDCILVGRYVSVADTAISTATVVGYQTADDPATDDIDDIKKNYNLGISTSSIERQELDWGTRLAWAKLGSLDQKSTTTPRSVAILVIRSPVTGTTYTFTSDNVTTIDTVQSNTLKSMMVATTTGNPPGQQARALCIDPGTSPANLSIVPEKMAIYIAAGAQDASAIETRTAGTFTAAGGNTQC